MYRCCKEAEQKEFIRNNELLDKINRLRKYRKKDYNAPIINKIHAINKLIERHIDKLNHSFISLSINYLHLLFCFLVTAF